MSTRPRTMEPVRFEPCTIYRGDCLDILPEFPPECVDLIYIDPPFNSNRNYEVFWGDTAERRAFDDRYGDAMAYIAYMRPRIAELHRVLKDTGSFYYHCDWHASHYIKVMLDEIFGANYFLCEIIWKRTSAHSSANRPGNNHDSLLLYSKSGTYTWNKSFQPYDEDYVETFFEHQDPDGRRWKRTDLTGAGTTKGPSGESWRDIDVSAKGRHWMYVPEELDRLDKDGKIHWPKKKGGMPRLKQYLDEMPGVPLQSIWSDIKPIHNLSQERLGYPTQKPMALLERVVKASSNEGDIVLDAFCGCGTTLAACENLDRQWLGIDISPTSCRVMGERIEKMGRKEMPIIGVGASGGSPDEWTGTGVPPDAPAARWFKYSNLPMKVSQLKELPPFEFENWAVLQVGQFFNLYAQPNRSKVGDLGIDGKLYLVSNVEKPKAKDSAETPLFKGVEGEKYLPIQVKQKDKAGRPDVDSFAHAVERDGRTGGVFVAFGYSRDAYKEIDRLYRRPERPLRIWPLTVERLIAEDFSTELDLWMQVGG